VQDDRINNIFILSSYNHLGESKDIIHLDHLPWKEIKYMTPISEDLGIGNKYIACPDLEI
jgi:hypothetical protein